MILAYRVREVTSSIPVKAHGSKNSLKELFLIRHALETLVNIATEFNFMFYVLKHFLRKSYLKIMLLKISLLSYTKCKDKRKYWQ